MCTTNCYIYCNPFAKFWWRAHFMCCDPLSCNMNKGKMLLGFFLMSDSERTERKEGRAVKFRNYVVWGTMSKDEVDLYHLVLEVLERGFALLYSKG